MRDFPFFTTDYGVASLLLKEIPYKKQAYICIRDVQNDRLEQHLQECVGFCKMAGAEKIYATGHEELDRYPLYTSVLKMRGQVNIIPEELAQLFPVTEQTVGRWRELHNQKMRDVDNAGTLEKRDEKRILESGGAYFIHENGKLLGIGWLDKNNILAIAGVVAGAGERIMKTMLSLRESETVTLEVASTNLRAVRLYEKLGFVAVEEISRWHQVM